MSQAAYSGIFGEDFKEIFSSQAVSLFGGLIAGVALASITNKFELLPGLLVALPCFLEMRGAISGTFASRLSSGLFLGVIKPHHENTDLIRSNILASFILALSMSLFLGLIAFGFNYFVFGIADPRVLFIILLAGMIANSIEIPIALFSTFRLFEDGHDPNNVMGPFITSAGDIVSIVSIGFAMVML